MTRPRLILASASPRRRDLLSDAGYDVLIAASDVEEMDSCHEGPEALAVINAKRKWNAVAPQYPNEIVVAADTVVWLDGRFYGKPVDFAEATVRLNRSQMAYQAAIQSGAMIQRNSLLDYVR